MCLFDCLFVLRQVRLNWLRIVAFDSIAFFLVNLLGHLIYFIAKGCMRLDKRPNMSNAQFYQIINKQSMIVL